MSDINHSAPPITLTPAEITEITGYKRPSLQLAALKRMGLPAFMRPDNTVSLGRAHYQAICNGPPQPDNRPQLQPIYNRQPHGLLAENSARIMLDLCELQARILSWPGEQPPLQSGIYFLFMGNDLMYVGKSINAQSRIQQHKDNGRVFDGWSFVAVPEIFLEDVERNYITKFTPPENVRILQPAYKLG